MKHAFIRKLTAGLAVLTLTFGMSISAMADEAPTDLTDMTFKVTFENKTTGAEMDEGHAFGLPQTKFYYTIESGTAAAATDTTPEILAGPEGGAKFGGIEVEFFNKKWDMRFADAVACNEVINPMNYSGWWYSVIPASIINENNLPIPLFIHYDDIEYGIRNEENGTILINGICVWHPQGANKAPISMNYYDVRNMLIANVGRHDELTAEQLIFHMKNRIVGDVIRYRYEAAERVFEAIDDFYKGPQYFMNLDPIENHKRLMSGNYKIQTPEETGIDLSQCVEVEDVDVPRWWYVWDAFCWLLPKFKKVRVAGATDHGLPYLAGSIYFYDESKKGGFLVKRDSGRAWKMCKRFFSTRRMIRNNHERVMKEWADAKKEFVSLAYWEKYLQI